MPDTKKSKKLRVYKFAADYNLATESIMQFLTDKGYSVKSHMSVLTDEMIADISSKFKKDIESAEKLIFKPIYPLVPGESGSWGTLRTSRSCLRWTIPRFQHSQAKTELPRVILPVFSFEVPGCCKFKKYASVFILLHTSDMYKTRV